MMSLAHSKRLIAAAGRTCGRIAGCVDLRGLKINPDPLLSGQARGTRGERRRAGSLASVAYNKTLKSNGNHCHEAWAVRS